MASLLHFVPNHERSSQTNLEEFIRVCREELTVFGTNLDWQDNCWPTAGVSFGNLDKGLHKLTAANTLSQPFLDFAKAYVRYQRAHNPTLARHDMKALKCLERALIEGHDAPELKFMTLGVLDRAAVHARAHYAPAAAYNAGRELARLAAFVSEKKLISFSLQWKNPIRRQEDTIRTGLQAREQRENKLPSNEVMNAMADIFAGNPQDDRDVFTTSVVAMLLCAPSRISEVLALKQDCEVWETKRDGTVAYGWRFQPGKGGSPMIKWIPDSMVTLAQEAIRRVRKITVEARRVASWLEDNPNLFYRHAACPDAPENKPLSVRESAMAIGLSHRYLRSARSRLRSYGLSGRIGGNSLATINKWVHKRLPENFPWFDKERGLRFSEALFCFNLYQLHAFRGTFPLGVWKPCTHSVNGDLCTYTIKGTTSPSIFERHNHTLGGSPLRANTHQFRHYLNTLAQRGGLGQAEIARWSGRKDVKQNRAYDQMSEFELADMLRRHDSTLTLDRPLAEIAEQITTLIPMTRQEFNTLAIPTAHVTDFGFCIHDYVMSPCQRYRDCINCTEQVCIKGDKRLDRLRLRYSQIKQLKQQAEEAIADGSAGADRWYEIQVLTETRLAKLIAILEDPSIEDGAIIRLKNEHEFSPLRRALEAKTERKRKVASTSELTHHNAMKGKSNGKTS